VDLMVQTLPENQFSPAQTSNALRVVGLMSGTSHDAVDAAACDLRLSGDTLTLTPLGHLSVPYPAALRSELMAALPPERTTLETVCRLDTRIGQAFADVAVRAVAELCGGDADLIVSHGQTVFHWAPDGGAVLGSAPCRSASLPGSPRRRGCPSSRACAPATSRRVVRALPWWACSTRCGWPADPAPPSPSTWVA
jgi:1,6-anhydro-N-acetylmuramate kinase